MKVRVHSSTVHEGTCTCIWLETETERGGGGGGGGGGEEGGSLCKVSAWMYTVHGDRERGRERREEVFSKCLPGCIHVHVCTRIFLETERERGGGEEGGSVCLEVYSE